MKCNDCGHEWEQDFQKNKKGQYILDGIKCPECDSKSHTIFLRHSG